MYTVDDLRRWVDEADAALQGLRRKQGSAKDEYQKVEARLKHLQGLLETEIDRPFASRAGRANQASGDGIALTPARPTSNIDTPEPRRFVRSPRNFVPTLRRAASKILAESGPIEPEDLYSRLPWELRADLERSTSGASPEARLARYLRMSKDFRFHTRTNLIALNSSAQDALANWWRESREHFDEKREGEPLATKYGLWSVAYYINTQFEPLGLKDLRETLRRARLPYTGWALWFVPSSGKFPIYSTGDSIECWLDREWDFWRVSKFGFTYLVRPFQEDFLFDVVQPGKEFDLTIPIWRIGECLMHAGRLTEALAGAAAPVIVKARWEGLAGRKLVARGSPHRILTTDYVATGDEIESFISVDSSEIQSNLPGLVGKLTRGLYEMFDFYAPSSGLINEELTSMLKSSVGGLP